jgi:hypothetical protein
LGIEWEYMGIWMEYIVAPQKNRKVKSYKKVIYFSPFFGGMLKSESYQYFIGPMDIHVVI